MQQQEYPNDPYLNTSYSLIFVNDSPTFNKTNTTLFADNLAIYAHSFSAIVTAKQLQIHIHMLEKYYKDWKIKMNKDKAEIIAFTRKKNDTNIFQLIRVYDHPTAPVHIVKCLGV